MNAKSKFKLHTYKTRLIVALIAVLLISSLTAVYVSIVNSNDPSTDDTIHVKNEKELTNAINKAKNPTTVKLDHDITLTKPIVISNKKEITLTSTTTENFFKLIGATDQTTINVDSGVLHLAGITVTHVSETNGLGVNVTEGGKLFMISGEISGNNGWGDRYGYGSGVAVYKDGFFEMTGGVIANNRGSRFGGGVWVGGFFNMSGNAVIANNYNYTDCTGCGVYNEGSFVMSGNSVIANNTAEFGGGVFNQGSFVMTGNSLITNNYALSGGGVYNEFQGSFVMTGNSLIANNTASMGDVSKDDESKGYVSKGGGVSNWGSFEMSDNAVISGNVADHGGGVCIDSGGSFVLSGNGMIVNNTVGRGGGVHVGEAWSSEEGVFEMLGGKISGNFAELDYGGVYNAGTFNQSGGIISGNKTNGKHPNQ
ncbi:MAG: hypothetical protein FWG55_01685 [Candidatus Bathyarchaeota archaeon]|nr:hypothetical protein [Candidatus Termiticorpusculum sp.]